jgi:type VI secretion system protein ImpK
VVEPGSLTLRDLAQDWFLFLSTFRRQAPSLDADTRWARAKLEDLLAEMERRSRTDARLEITFLEAKPILVYLADEVLLTSEWAGEMDWAGELLETAHFNTQIAGEDFFDRLEKALAADKPEILEIYFKALCLGFRGRLMKQQDELDRLRRDLYRRLPAERVEGGRLYPAAYESIDNRRFVKLPVVAVARVIIALLVFLIGIYLIAKLSFGSQLEELDSAADGYLERTTDDETDGT